jgi:hypothetical protein
VECTYKILAFRQIYASLSAHTGIDLSKQRSWNLSKSNSAKVASRRESGDVTNNSASNRDHEAFTIYAGLNEFAVQVSYGFQVLAAFARRDGCNYASHAMRLHFTNKRLCVSFS